MFGINIGKLGCLRKAASVFSPANLFAAGEQGIWLDCSDLSTLFTDAAGTTPVTAEGQPVGLILDKSKGLVLGSELVTNGDFSSTTEWTLGSGASISGGVLTLTTTGSDDSLATTTFSSTNGKRYELVVTIVSSTTAGTGGQSSATVAVGNGGGVFDLGGLPPGTYKYYPQVFYTGQTSVSLNIYNNTPTTTVFDSISIKELAGNHASQATAAARPLKTSTGLSKWINYDAIDDVLNTTFPSSLGSNCTVARAVVGGSPVILTGQTIGTSYADSTDHAGLIIINRALTTQETNDLTAWMTAKGATA